MVDPFCCVNFEDGKYFYIGKIWGYIFKKIYSIKIYVGIAVVYFLLTVFVRRRDHHHHHHHHQQQQQGTPKVHNTTLKFKAMFDKF
jgi:hypothetical protein